MADPFKAVGNYFAAKEKSKAARGAARAEMTAAERGIDTQEQSLQAIYRLLSPYMEAGSPDLTQPYVQAGEQGLQGLQGLLGLRGAGEQQAAINQIQQGAQFQELAQQGEQGILQNAAATGGLRGGNVQGALAQFRPALLNQLIESQYGKLAGLAGMGGTAAQNLLSMGQQTASGLATAEQQSGSNISNLLVKKGAAQAGGILGAGAANAQLYQQLGSAPSDFVKDFVKIASALG